VGGVSAIAAISATKSGILPVEISPADGELTQNDALAPVSPPPSGTELPFRNYRNCRSFRKSSVRHGRHFGRFVFSGYQLFSRFSHFSSLSRCAFRMAKSYKLSASSYSHFSINYKLSTIKFPLWL
jgi:hypothetical protein